MGTWRKTIKVPFVEVKADRKLAEVIAVVAYFISGYLAYLSVSRARRIMLRLSSSPQLRDAVLMYPSIPTFIMTGTRIAAISLPILILLASTVPFFFMMPANDWRGLLFMTLLLSTPWFALINELRHPLSEIKYKLSEQSLKQLRDSGVDDEVVSKLQSIQDKEYSNRDKFLDAMQVAVGKGRPVEMTKRILPIACEEGIEN